MPLTVSPQYSTIEGVNKASVGTVTFTGSYTTGGYLVTPAEFGFSRLIFVAFSPCEIVNSNANLPVYRPSTGRIVLFRGSLETPNAVALGTGACTAFWKAVGV